MSTSERKNSQLD